MSSWDSTTATYLLQLRQQGPLVHNITNQVVINSSANILLAVGASPVMAHSRREVAEIVAAAQALVVNIGTLDTPVLEAMHQAAVAARQQGVPVVLDPVGAGATAFRTQAVQTLLQQGLVSVLRGNASEVLALAGTQPTTRGVDSGTALAPADQRLVQELASHYQCVVAVSGEEDYVTDGQSHYLVGGGHGVMTRITGLGCGLSAVCGAFCGIAPQELLPATVAACAFYGHCGAQAAQCSLQPGSFYVAFVDQLYALQPEAIAQLPVAVAD